jgi:hypothetical protein
MGREPGDLARILFRDNVMGRPSTDHPDDESLATLLESGTPERADPRLVEHLASCDRCRRDWIRMRRGGRELGAVADLADPPWEIERGALGPVPVAAGQKPRRWRIMPAYRLILSGAAALVLAGVALLIPWQRMLTGESLRSQPRQESLRPLEPVGEIRTGEFPAFCWTTAPGATAYEIVVAESSTGRTVLRVRTTEPRHVLTDEEAVLLEPGREYRWLIQAERGTGRTQTGQPVTFSVLPTR